MFMRKKTIARSRGFTLVEMLLVVSLFAVVALSIYHAFSNGLKVWERGRQFMAEEDLDIFFDKFSRELRNTFDFSQIGFAGKETSIKFATRIRTPADRALGLEKDALIDQIGGVEYYFDTGKKTIYKKEFNYSQATNQKAGAERQMLQRVKAVNFLYFYIDADGNLGQTRRISSVPAAVEIRIEMEGPMEEDMIKLVNIPAGV